MVPNKGTLANEVREATKEPAPALFVSYTASGSGEILFLLFS